MVILPTIHISITSTAIAAYGAALSTITACFQIIHHLRDRRNVTVTVQKNMRIFGHPKYAGMTLVVVKVVNSGRRPVTVTSIGAYNLHPHDAFVAFDTTPQLPCELTEGKYVVTYLNQADLNTQLIEFWTVSDSLGNEYKLNVAPWYKRAWSSHLRIREARRQATAKSA